MYGAFKMTALRKIEQAGFRVFLDGDNLAITPAKDLTLNQREFLKLHKAEIIAELKSIKVICYTPNGNPIEVTASSAEHAEYLRRWNPDQTTAH
jgi:chaperone required for assembly of F1-ATPase